MYINNMTNVISIINKEDTKDFKEVKEYLKSKNIKFEVNAINNNNFRISFKVESETPQIKIIIFKELLNNIRTLDSLI